MGVDIKTDHSKDIGMTHVRYNRVQRNDDGDDHALHALVIQTFFSFKYGQVPPLDPAIEILARS